MIVRYVNEAELLDFLVNTPSAFFYSGVQDGERHEAAKRCKKTQAHQPERYGEQAAAPPDTETPSDHLPNRLSARDDLTKHRRQTEGDAQGQRNPGHWQEPAITERAVRSGEQTAAKSDRHRDQRGGERNHALAQTIERFRAVLRRLRKPFETQVLILREEEPNESFIS